MPHDEVAGVLRIEETFLFLFFLFALFLFFALFCFSDEISGLWHLTPYFSYLGNFLRLPFLFLFSSSFFPPVFLSMKKPARELF